MDPTLFGGNYVHSLSIHLAPAGSYLLQKDFCLQDQPI